MPGKRRLVAGFLTFVAGAIAAGTVAAVRDDIAVRNTSSEASAEGVLPGEVVVRGSDRISWTKLEGGLSPLTSDGRGLWFASGSGQEVYLYGIDADRTEAHPIAPLTWDEFPKWLWRAGEATVLLPGESVVVVHDDGRKESVRLAGVQRSAGLSTPAFVESAAVADGVLYVARLGALEVQRFGLDPLVVLDPIALPEGVPPPQSIRVLDDGRLLLGAHLSHPEKGHLPGLWLLDSITGKAEAVPGVAAPFAFSSTGPIIFNDSGQLSQLEISGTTMRVSKRGALPPGMLAASMDGATWSSGFKESAITYRDAGGKTVHFELPQIATVPRRPPGSTGTEPRPPRIDQPVPVTSMAVLDDGSLVFTVEGLPWIGRIAPPR